MPLYIVRAGVTDIVKIGCSRNVAQRLQSMQPHHYEDLVLLRTIEGDRTNERWLQHRFADRHIAREWYRFHPDMMTVKIGTMELPPRHDGELRHPLRCWLFQRGESVNAFSARVGIQKGYVSAIMNGIHIAPVGIMDKITVATGGAITANHFQRVVSSEEAAA